MLKKYVICLPLALSGCAVPIVGGIGTVGMSAVEDRGLSGVASDQVLRVKLNDAFFTPFYEFTGVGFTIYKGRVLLTGIVPNEKTKKAAVTIAKNVPGVQAVIDGLNIQEDDTFLDDARDTWMTTKLKACLYADQDIYAPNYLVHTYDRVIYIFGTAPTKEEITAVISHAREISGVRKVVNFIEVGGMPQNP